MYSWEIQFNQAGKRPKWHDLRKLQWGKSKIYKPQNTEKVHNVCPFPAMDLLMRNPWHSSRNFIHYAVLKMGIAHFPLIHLFDIYSPLYFWLNRGTTFLSCLLTDHFNSISTSSVHPSESGSFKSTGLIILYRWDYLNLLEVTTILNLSRDVFLL